MKNRLVRLAVVTGFLASVFFAPVIPNAFAETADELAGRAIDLYKKEQKELKESLRTKELKLNEVTAALKEQKTKDRESLKNAWDQVTDLQKEVTAKDTELSEVNASLSTMRQQRDELQENYSNLQDILDERGNQLTKAQTDHVKLTKQYEAYKGTVQQKMERLSGLQKENNALLLDRQALHRTKSELETTQQARSKLETNYLAARDEVDDLSEKYENSQGTYSELLRQLRLIQGDNAEMEAQMKASKALAVDRLAAKEELAKELEKTNQRFMTLQTSRSLLLQQVSELEERVSDAVLIQRELAKDLGLQRATVVAISGVDLVETESLKKSLADAQREVAKLSSEAKYRSENLLSVKSSVGQYKQEAREAQSEVAQLEQKIRQEQFNFQREFEQLQRRRGTQADEKTVELRREKFSLQGRVEAMEEERESLLERLSDAERDKLEFQEESVILTQRMQLLKANSAMAPQTSSGGSETLEEANQQLSRLQADLKAQKGYSDQLKDLLNAREEALADQQETMRRLKEEKTHHRTQTPLASSEPAEPLAKASAFASTLETTSPGTVETSNKTSKESAVASSNSAEVVDRSKYLKSPATVVGETATAPIFAVTEVLGFVVLDVKDISWAKEGARIQVQIGEDQTLEMEIGEREKSGLAVAQVLGEPPSPFPFKVGDTASIRRIQ